MSYQNDSWKYSEIVAAVAASSFVAVVVVTSFVAAAAVASSSFVVVDKPFVVVSCVDSKNSYSASPCSFVASDCYCDASFLLHSSSWGWSCYLTHIQHYHQDQSSQIPLVVVVVDRRCTTRPNRSMVSLLVAAVGMPVMSIDSIDH